MEIINSVRDFGQSITDCPSVVMLTADRRVDRRILLEANTLRSVGWDVRILAMPSDNKFNRDDPSHGIVRILQASARINYESLVIRIYKWLRARLPMNGWAMKQIKRFAWRFLIDQELFYENMFLPTAQQLSPTVFVAHDLPLLPLAYKLAKRSGAKLVYDSHELYSEQEFSDWEKRRWTDIESRYINGADAVITVNESIADELVNRYGIVSAEVIYNAENEPVLLDNEQKLFHAEFGLDPSSKVLLLQGGISQGRNIDVLVAGMKWVCNPKIRLVVLGDGIYVKNLKRFVDKNRLNDRVFFMPAVPQDQLLRMTASADAGVIPYRATCLNNYYCTPNKLFEFISVGLPIVATDLPEIKKIIQANQIGLVGDTSAPQFFANLIDEFFSDEIRFDLWRSNLKLVKTKFSWESQQDKIVNVFNSLLQ